MVFVDVSQDSTRKKPAIRRVFLYVISCCALPARRKSRNRKKHLAYFSHVVYNTFI